MKAYVSGYDTILDNEENSKKQPKPPQFVVEYSAEPKWIFESRREAGIECQNLQNKLVHVGMHYCNFSVEELPSNKFAIICANHIGGRV